MKEEESIRALINKAGKSLEASKLLFEEDTMAFPTLEHIIQCFTVLKLYFSVRD